MSFIQLLNPQHFPAYQLIDSGGFEKLERFGKYILIRPEPQAVWDKKLSVKQWEEQAHVRFVSRSSSSGAWQKLKTMPDRWQIDYFLKGLGTWDEGRGEKLTFRLSLTSFKHLGIFPEQAPNWDYIIESVKGIKTTPPKVLNLFAYTGGASLAAKAAGADITHVDSIKQVVSWANENMTLSGLKDIRWTVEDAMKFVKREVKRGKKYHGIILDPPAYGHGPTGESWKLEEQLAEMMKNVALLLDEKEHFLILNTYSLGFSSLIIENIFKDNFEIGTGDGGRETGEMEIGELFLKDSFDRKLPLGVYGRFRKSYELYS